MDIHGKIENDDLVVVIDRLKSELEKYGDVVHVNKNDSKISVSIQYTEFNYKFAEFSQVQVRDGVIEFIKSDVGCIVRNTQNYHLNNIRQTLLENLDKNIEEPINKIVISLFDILSVKLRSKFFMTLLTHLAV